MAGFVTLGNTLSVVGPQFPIKMMIAGYLSCLLAL